jgi:hypothetical protein
MVVLASTSFQRTELSICSFLICFTRIYGAIFGAVSRDALPVLRRGYSSGEGAGRHDALVVDWDRRPRSARQDATPPDSLVDNQGMDVPALLQAACLLVPEATATENDVTLDDVWEYLIHDEWEVALGLLEHFGDGRPLPLTFWEALADAAEQLRLERSTAWCQWRCSELRNGMVRADLTLRPATDARRKTPVPGPGVLRPMWDIGRRSSTGQRAVSIGGLWVESMPALEPGGRATVRIVPLTPSHWRHVRTGQQITMHEDRTVAGTATVLEIRPPGIVTPSS